MHVYLAHSILILKHTHWKSLFCKFCLNAKPYYIAKNEQVILPRFASINYTKTSFRTSKTSKYDAAITKSASKIRYPRCVSPLWLRTNQWVDRITRKAFRARQIDNDRDFSGNEKARKLSLIKEYKRKERPVSLLMNSCIHIDYVSGSFVPNPECHSRVIDRLVATKFH